ncbi:MAG: phytoene/squalene synthase family protein [Spirochaetaceae bacterium]
MGAEHTHYRVFRNGSKTYFNSSVFFPKDVRSDVFVLYGFVRVADDFVDSAPQDASGFRAFRTAYRQALDGKPAGDEIIDPFVELSRRRRFAPEWTEAFLSSMEMDLTKTTYRRLEETLEYIYGSAEVIGLYMARILELPTAAFHAAMMQGRAMQFINFVRDVAEDNGLGRTYLPLAETTLPDLSEDSARADPGEFERFIRAQLDRYDEWQAVAEGGYDFIPKRVLVPVKTASDMYNWTGRVIRENPMTVFSRKVKPSRPRILLNVARNAFRLSAKEHGSESLSHRT